MSPTIWSLISTEPTLVKNINGLRFPKNIIYFKTTESEGKVVHPTQKPVALLEYLIKTYTNENDTVLDFTMGSGSTGIACKNLNREFIGIELDKKYFNIASERINNENNRFRSRDWEEDYWWTPKRLW